MSFINWLHITDWHVGQTEQNCRWPNFRAEFEKDLSDRIAKVGAIDVVFFTGDLVQSGDEKEFLVLEQRLSKLWELLRKAGSNPQLVIVPGNHDLVRPEVSNPTALALSSWGHNRSVEEAFWAREKAELRSVVDSWFSPLSEWMARTSIPLLAPIHKGQLVGDALYLFEKPEIRLGILGLNSTFMQFRGGNLEGLLELSPKQIPDVPNSDYAAFLEDCHVRVLMTHQPVGWLSKKSQEDFFTDIWPSSRFDLHLCGHLHAPKPSATSHGGSSARHTYIGASFFGLEKFGESGGFERIHGYALGQWIVDNSTIKEVYWPRIAHKKHDGAFGLIADPAAYLTNESSSERSWENRLATKSISGQPTSANPTKQVFDSELTELSLSEAQSAQKKFPQLPYVEVSHHWAVRSDERSSLQSTLQNNGIAFLVSDWGFGKDEFLSTCFHSEDQTESPRVYVLRCDAFNSVAEIELGFKHQFGVPLHSFLNISSVVGVKCLILDGVQPVITQGSHCDEFSRLCGVIRDFAPNTKLLLTGRMPPGGGPTEIQLKPLDTLETRSYVEAHPLKQQELLSPEAVERLHYASGGLTTQIDRLLERLQVASLNAVLDEESELRSTADVSDAALSHCIRMLDHEGESRAGMLLRALVILPFGETIEGVKRFFSKHPLFPTHAKLLQDLALIEVIPVHQSSQSVSTALKNDSPGGSSPKILRVPKQVRASVLGGMNQEERERYLHAAGEFIFGPNWRGGAIKLRKVPPEYRDYVNSGLGNEYAVISALLSHALTIGNVGEVKIAVRLGLHYCGVLKAADRNRDLRIVSSDLIRQLDGLGYEAELGELHALCGRAHRLTGDYIEAAKHFELSLEVKTPKARKESTGHKMLGLASALLGSEEKEKAAEVVERAQSLAKAGTLLSSQLEAKKAVLTGGDAEYDALVKIEADARGKGWISHANDIALNLARRESDNEKKLLWLKRVLTSSETGWNLYRAVVDKARLAASTKSFSSLSFQDRVNLRAAYSFCHAQRLNMFDSCHRCLWQLFEAEGNIPLLYSLFRSSSFIWRLRGDEKIELEYYQRLSNAETGVPDDSKKSTFRVEIEYFAKRAKILILRIVGK
jgi:hypothetical protein